MKSLLEYHGQGMTYNHLPDTMKVKEFNISGIT